MSILDVINSYAVCLDDSNDNCEGCCYRFKPQCYNLIQEDVLRTLRNLYSMNDSLEDVRCSLESKIDTLNIENQKLRKTINNSKPPTVDSIKIYAVEEFRKNAYNDLANDLVCEILNISDEDFTPGYVTWLIDKITREKIMEVSKK